MNVSAMAKATVLIVDDEAPLRAMLKFEVESLGCLALEAANGLDALAVLKAAKVAMIISDVRMPRHDGFKLLDDVRRIYGVAPIFILMSGCADVPLWEAYDRGAEAWLGKPFDLEIIGHLVQSLGSANAHQSTVGERKPERNVEVRFRDAAEARSLAGIQVGRGGFFLPIAAAGLMPKQWIGFQIYIGPDPLPWFAGRGLVKWSRDSPTTGLAAGCGIEFSTLESPLAALLVPDGTLRSKVAYIPKGGTTP